MSLPASLGAMISQIPALNADDPLALAVRVMRDAPGRAAPVVAHGRLLGIVTESSVAAAWTHGDPNEATVECALLAGVPCIPITAPVQEACSALSASGLPGLPVADEAGRIRGMLQLPDVYQWLAGAPRPPSPGGMATPWGVYLTGSGARGGTHRWWQLAGTGLVLTLGIMLSAGIALGLYWLVQQFVGWPLYELSMSTGDRPLIWEAAALALRVLPIGLFALLLRLSPLAGYHAAEHMTVHAIEQGLPLTPQVVARMPRVHPRCGTNLAVGAAVFSVLASVPAGEWSDLTALMALVVMLGTWRRLGGWVQQHVSTRPPTREQIEAGIRAGEELIEQYRIQGPRPMNWRRRLVHSGLPWVLLGAAAVWLPAYLLAWRLG